MNSLVVSAARCRLYVNNKIYAVTQDVSVTIETGEYPIFGINSPYPQEIAGGGQNIVKGSAKVVRTSNSGGLQGVNLRPLFSDLAASSYVTLRLEDRQTSETLWSIPKAKITNVVESVTAKGIYHTSFQFIGQILFWPLDLS
jgi:hypothetical protein